MGLNAFLIDVKSHSRQISQMYFIYVCKTRTGTVYSFHIPYMHKKYTTNDSK